MIGGEPSSQIASQGSACQASSHACDGAAEPMFAVALLRRRWSWHDVDAKSC
jgi:hypothetical protein